MLLGLPAWRSEISRRLAVEDRIRGEMNTRCDNGKITRAWLVGKDDRDSADGLFTEGAYVEAEKGYHEQASHFNSQRQALRDSTHSQRHDHTRSSMSNDKTPICLHRWNRTLTWQRRNEASRSRKHSSQHSSGIGLGLEYAIYEVKDVHDL